MRAPGSNLGEKDAEYVIELIEDMEPLECDENHMTIKYIGTAIRVSKFNKRIRKSEQVECITTTTISGTNLLKDICSIKIFDDDGIALRLGKSLSYDVRTADFSPATNANGKNLAPLFREYLITHGLANLVP
jgi:hypothetical protein